MKKFVTLFALSLAFMPSISQAQNLWESVAIQYPGVIDSLKMKQDDQGRLCFVIDEAFLRHIISPADFKAMRDDGSETNFVVGDIDLSQGEQLCLNLPLVKTDRGLCYKLNIFIPKMAQNLYVEFFPHKPFHNPDSVTTAVYEELVIYDYRTKKSTSIRTDENLPEFGFDVVDFEHDGRFGHPNYVYSTGPDGRSHGKKVNHFHTGTHASSEEGRGIIYNAAIEITPYEVNVQAGERVYHFTMVMKGNNKVHKKLVIKTDPPTM